MSDGLEGMHKMNVKTAFGKTYARISDQVANKFIA